MIPTAPISTEKSVRRDRKRVLTSSKAGKIVPLAFVPLLREDRVSRGRMTINVEMMETAEMLMNAIHVNVYAHFVPLLAFERFNGMDQFNRSYKGIPETEGGTPVPFFTTHAFNRNMEVYKAAGIHSRNGRLINTAYVEAYNAVVNFRRKARSGKLPLRANLDTTLAEGFWHHTSMAHIVPDFDQAMIDGEVPLQVAMSDPLANVVLKPGLLSGQVPAFRRINGGTPAGEGVLMAAASGRPRIITGTSPGSAPDYIPVNTYGDARFDPNGTLVADLSSVFSEMQGNGLRLSLSNIELAKKTAAFAKIRSQYRGIDDEHIIDLLMDGIRVPDEALRQPILLDRKSTILGYSKRYTVFGKGLQEASGDYDALMDEVDIGRVDQDRIVDGGYEPEDPEDPPPVPPEG